MSRIARVTGREQEERTLAAQARKVKNAFNVQLYDRVRGVYVDGEGAEHASLHANMFPLAFGLVPHDRVPQVVAFVKSRGMACSVYGAQFLLEALYRAGEGEHAFSLMTAIHDRSWWNMIRAGSTITLEAWDLCYKNNLDWNHAWGAAPANVIPGGLMGVRPLQPGFAHVAIAPQPGPLASAALTLPTIRGPVHVGMEQEPGQTFALEVDLSANTTARVSLPLLGRAQADLELDGRRIRGSLSRPGSVTVEVGSGRHRLQRASQAGS
jgi:hypothetical protein